MNRALEHVEPFYFYVNIGDYTGVSAASYNEFLNCIKHVEAKSLRFHVERGDFERWAMDVLKDGKLAKEMAKIRKQKLRGQVLRNRLHHTVSQRHEKSKPKTRRTRKS